MGTSLAGEAEGVQVIASGPSLIVSTLLMGHVLVEAFVTRVAESLADFD